MIRYLNKKSTEEFGVQLECDNLKQRHFLKSRGFKQPIRTIKRFNNRVEKIEFLKGTESVAKFSGTNLSATLETAFRAFFKNCETDDFSQPVGVDVGIKRQVRNGWVYSSESDMMIAIPKWESIVMSRGFKAQELFKYVAFLMYLEYIHVKLKELNITLNIALTSKEQNKLASVQELFSKFEFVTGYAGAGKTHWVIGNFDKEKTLVLTNSNDEKKKLKKGGFKNVRTHSMVEECFRNMSSNRIARLPFIKSIKNYDTIVVDEFTRITPEFLSMLLAAKKRNTRVIFVGDKGQLGTVNSNLKPFADRLEAQTVKKLTEIKRQNEQTLVHKAVQYLVERQEKHSILSAPTTRADVLKIKGFEMKHRVIKTETTVGLEYKNIQKAMQLEAGQLRALVKKSRVVSGPLLKLAKEAKLELEGEGKVRTVHYWTLRNGDVVIPARDVKSSSLKAMRQLFLEFKKLDGKKAKKLIDTERTYMTVYASQGITIKGAVTILTDVFKATLDAVYVAVSRPTRGYMLLYC